MTPEERGTALVARLLAVTDTEHFTNQEVVNEWCHQATQAIEDAVEEMQSRMAGKALKYIAEEREACAKVAELFYSEEPEANHFAHKIAAAIRNRK